MYFSRNSLSNLEWIMVSDVPERIKELISIL